MLKMLRMHPWKCGGSGSGGNGGSVSSVFQGAKTNMKNHLHVTAILRMHSPITVLYHSPSNNLVLAEDVKLVGGSAENVVLYPIEII
jgi:hypothetical protein